MDTQKNEDDQVKVGNRSSLRWSDLGVRMLGLVLTVAAAVVLGVAKQTKVVPVQLVPSLPPLNVPATAKWHHLSAFVYFVVCNAIAGSYAAVSMALTLATRGGKKKKNNNNNLALIITILDLLMVALLFSGNGATAAVGVIGYKGNSHVRWNKVCNVFDRFCHQVAAAVVMSLLGSLAYLWLVVLAAINLHKKHD